MPPSEYEDGDWFNPYAGRIYLKMGSSIASGTLFPIDNLPEGLLYQPDFLSQD